MEWGALGRVVWACAVRAQAPTPDVVASPQDAAPAAASARAAERAAGPLSRLAPADRADVDRVLAAADDDPQRTTLLQAVAAGHDVVTLRRLAEATRGTTADGRAALLDPLRRQLRQRSGTTCGSACLVTARALTDPVYALWLLDGFDARTGRRTVVDLPGRFAAAERVVHARTTAAVLPDGQRQVPWPRVWGTPPWAVATELTRILTPAGDVGGPRFRTRLVDPDDEGSRRCAADAVTRAVADGAVAALFVGDGVSPRHVTLAVAATVADGPGLAVYEPGSGQVLDVPRADLVGGRAVLGGWDRLWAVVVPG